MVTDFARGSDDIEIEAALFGGGRKAGSSREEWQIVSSSTPIASRSGQGVFLFDTDNGLLRWDADGAGAAQAIATLTGVTALTKDDSLIV